MSTEMRRTSLMADALARAVDGPLYAHLWTVAGGAAGSSNPIFATTKVQPGDSGSRPRERSG
jgi:hypothetical protein